MINPQPITLATDRVCLEPLSLDHHDGLVDAATDGKLWELWHTSVRRPEETRAYIETALVGQRDGHMLPMAVRDLESDRIVGSTRYHDIVAEIDRVEIGYTFYAASVQRSHINTTCKRLLMEHAFERLGCAVVGLRTDSFNLTSQRAIAGLGAQRDGVIRHHAPRSDGSARSTVMFSILVAEWPDVRRHLDLRLARRRPPEI